MKKHDVKLYFKDEPFKILDRVIAELEGDENLEDIEKLPSDDYIFYYMTEPYEMDYLKNPENNEEFVITKVGKFK